MGNAALLLDSVLQGDDVTVSASGTLLSTPPDNVLTTPTQRRWLVDSDTFALTFDCGAEVDADTFHFEWLVGTNPSFQLLLSLSDPSAAAGDVYNSGLQSGTPYFDPRYGRLVFALTSVKTFRYMRLYGQEVGASFMGLGYAGAGVREAFGINYQAPHTRTAARRSVDTEGVNGQVYIDLRQGKFKEQAQFGFLSEDERNGFIEDLMVEIVNEGHKDFLWLRDPESTNLSRDSLFGYVEGDLAVSQDLYVIPPVFSVSLPMAARL